MKPTLAELLNKCSVIFAEPLIIEDEIDVTVKMAGHEEIDITCSFDTDRWTVIDNYFNMTLDSYTIPEEAVQAVMEQVASNLAERILEL